LGFQIMVCCYVVCVVSLWFVPPRSKMHITSWGCRLQRYHTYNSEGIEICLIYI
jgi:hypothetical protein